MNRACKRRRVLVVDDLDNHRDGLARLLRWDGWEVDTAPNGFAALDIARARTPDVVVTDLHMPGMNGLELIRKLHAHDARIPVILVTATSSANLDAAATLAGAACCMMKPLDLARLATALAQALTCGSSSLACRTGVARAMRREAAEPRG